MFQMTFVEPR